MGLAPPTPLYCHGLPGGASELSIAGVDMPVLDRTGAPVSAVSLPDTPVHLIGFSLGAAFALRLATAQPTRIAKLTLISAAAPLELGEFLPYMAGRKMLEMAQHPRRFLALTWAQSMAARLATGALARGLINTCDPADQAVLRHPAEFLAFCQTLRQGYGPNRATYLQEVQAYVQPWADQLSQVQCPVTLHHGTADQWAPFTMAEALAQAMPQAQLRPHAGLGHYTTLRAALRDFAA